MEIILTGIICAAVCATVCALLTAYHNRKLRRYADSAALQTTNTLRNALAETIAETEANRETLKELSARVLELENGTVPDYEQAKAAAKAVNDFSAGISSIMGYDPFEVRRKSQEERGDLR